MKLGIFFGIIFLNASWVSAQAVPSPFSEPLDWKSSGWPLEAQTLKTPKSPVGWLIDFEDDVSAQTVNEVLRNLGLKKGENFLKTAGRRISIPSLSHKHLQWLKSREDVESIEPNQVLSLFQEAPPQPPKGKIENPDDPLYKSQWHFEMINLTKAWKKADGEDIIVAVIDTGVSFGKLDGKKSKYPRVPDLKETTFVPGYNFVDNNEDPSDGNGHGTHVAGTIAQSTNNGIGVAGIAPKASIMPIKVLSDGGSGSLGDISKGIRFAADNGAHVINMSLGGGFYSPSMHKAIKYAHSKGVAVVCAAGNTGRPRVEYPARYPECIAVSAVGPDGELAFYSSHGEQIAVAAPGGDTRVDLNGDGLPDGVLQDTIAQGDPTQHGYFPFQGTSMATPHVAGVAALIMSTGVTDPDAVREIIMSSSEKRSDQLKYGAGVLDGGQAVAEPSESESTFAGLFVLLFGFAAMRFKKYGVAQVPTYGGLLVLTFWVSGAFSWISSGWFSSPFTLPLHLFGPEFHLHPFLVNSLWVVVPTLLCWGIKGARVPLAGFAMGAGAFFLAQAYLGYVDLSVIVGHGMADALWLTFNGLISLSLGLFVWRNAHFKR